MIEVDNGIPHGKQQVHVAHKVRIVRLDTLRRHARTTNDPEPALTVPDQGEEGGVVELRGKDDEGEVAGREGLLQEHGAVRDVGLDGLVVDLAHAGHVGEGGVAAGLVGVARVVLVGVVGVVGGRDDALWRT